MSKKRVLITGSNGFIGKALCQSLVKKNQYEVFPSSRKKNELENFVQLDLKDRSGLQQKLPRDLSCIIHCAGQTGLSTSLKPFYENNFLATKNLVDQAIENQVEEFIFISTPSIYLQGKDQLSIDETQIPERILTSYAQSKLQCEEYLENKKNHFKSITILRPGTVYGPGATNLAKIIIENQKKRFLIQFADQHTKISMTYIDNLVHAIGHIIEADTKEQFGVYNFSDEQAISMSEEFLENYFLENKIAFKRRQLPFKPFYHLALFIQTAYKFFSIEKSPFLSVYAVCNLGKNRILNTERFNRDFKYNQSHSKEQSLKAFKLWIEKYKEGLS